MNKKLLSLLLVFMLSLSLLAGCDKKEDPKEKLADGFKKSVEMKTAKESIDLEVSFDSSMQDPQMDMVKNMINGAKLTGQFDLDQEKNTFVGKMNLASSGMAYDFELFFNPKQYFIKAPMMEQYFVIFDEEDSIFTEDMDQAELKKMNEELVNVMLDLLSDKNLTLEETKTVEINGVSTEVTPIKITMNDKEFKVLVQKMMIKLFENPMFVGQIKESVKMELEASGEEVTDEAINAKIQEGKKEFTEEFSKIDEVFNVDKFETVYYFDADNNIVKNDLDMLFTFTVPEEETTEDIVEGVEATPGAEKAEPVTFTIGLKGTSDIWDINVPIEFDFPELTDENSFRMDEMMQPMPEPEMDSADMEDIGA